MKPVSPPAMLPALGSSLASELLAPGTEIGPYELEALITFGISGGLYSAVTRLGRQRVCVWILPRLASAQKDFRKKFYNASSALASVEDPTMHLPKRVEWNDQRGLVEMPHVEWPTLEHLLLTDKAEELLNEALVRKILLQVASAIASAHQKGVCHLNCIPANIFIGPKDQVRVGGFGFIESLGSEIFQRLTSASVPPVRGETWNVSLHTNDLRAPELLAGNIATQATDIYYFGVLAYFLITGQRPLPNNPQPPSVIRADINRGWDVLIGRCLDGVSMRQSMSMAEVAKDLESLGQPRRGGIWRDEGPSYTDDTVRNKFSFSKKYLYGGIAALTIGAMASGVLLLDLDNGAGDNVPRVKLAASPAEANFRLNVSPHRFLATFEGSGSGKFHENDGQLLARLPQGEYHLTLEAANHHSQSFTFVPGASEPDLDIELEPAFAELVIQTAPGSRIDVLAPDGGTRYLTTANTQGLAEVEQRLFTRTYKLQLSAPGYHTRTEVVELAAGDNSLLNLPLAGKPVKLEVAGPQGASLWLDGKNVGTVPALLDAIESGREVTLRIEAPGSRPIVRQIFLRPGQDTRIDVAPLEARTGELEIAVVSDFNVSHEDVQIEVDGSLHPAGDRIQLPAGQHLLRFIHPNFLPEDRTVEIKDRGYTKINVHLQPRPARLELRVNPQQPVVLTVDGLKTSIPETGILELVPGKDVEVEISAVDHLITRRRLRLGPNEFRVWNLDLVKIPGPQADSSWQLPYSGEGFQWIPAGTFALGSIATEHENRPNETPRTSVTLSQGFWMASREVSQAFWSEFMDQNPSEFKGTSLPVHNVTWLEAFEFCEKLSAREASAGRLPEGYIYRLPTEAEWEYACRAGSETPFSFGDKASPADGHFVGTYPRSASNETLRGDPGYGPVAVGSFPANALQLHDMHGNVAEWCLDFFNARYPGGAVTDWQGPVEGIDRAVRGGSWRDFAHRNRSAARERLAPLTRSNAVGFRVVLAPVLPAR